MITYDEDPSSTQISCNIAPNTFIMSLLFWKNPFSGHFSPGLLLFPCRQAGSPVVPDGEREAGCRQREGDQAGGESGKADGQTCGLQQTRTALHSSGRVGSGKLGNIRFSSRLASVGYGTMIAGFGIIFGEIIKVFSMKVSYNTSFLLLISLPRILKKPGTRVSSTLCCLEASGSSSC